MQEFGSSMPFYGSQVVMNGFGYMRPFNGGQFLIPSMYGTCTSLSYAYAKATDVYGMSLPAPPSHPVNPMIHYNSYDDYRPC